MAEFASDQILGMNTQIVESGVVDTMEDIIANTIGSIIAAIMIVIGTKDNRAFNGIISRLTRKILPIVK